MNEDWADQNDAGWNNRDKMPLPLGEQYPLKDDTFVSTTRKFVYYMSWLMLIGVLLLLSLFAANFLSNLYAS